LLAFLLFRRKLFPLFSPVTRSMRRLEALEKRHESFFPLAFVFSVSMMRGRAMLARGEGRGCLSRGRRAGRRIGAVRIMRQSRRASR
jgi:hypothetical protein